LLPLRILELLQQLGLLLLNYSLGRKEEGVMNKAEYEILQKSDSLKTAERSPMGHALCIKKRCKNQHQN
jgi:hypothetical protein